MPQSDRYSQIQSNDLDQDFLHTMVGDCPRINDRVEDWDFDTVHWDDGQSGSINIAATSEC